MTKLLTKFERRDIMSPLIIAHTSMGSMPKVIGTDHVTRLSTGKRRRVVLLNNAATTPPFQATWEAVNNFLKTYGTFHRGAGPHADQTYKNVQEAINAIRKFLGVSKDQALLFTQNTSSAINLFIRLLGLKRGDIILTSTIEHTSNNLPWLHNSPAKVVYINAFDDGALDYADVEAKMKQYEGRVKLIAITGASNMTGFVPDVVRLSELAHKHHSLLFVDAAQLAPHRPIHMHREGIDALAFSAHKVYAPFGLGVLALPMRILDRQPVDPGGGSIDMISEKDIVWAPFEVRHQTGTWNVTGIIAAGASCKTLMDFGWAKLLRHEKSLVDYATKKLSAVPGIISYFAWEKYRLENRIGTITFNLPKYHHALVSAILEHEYGIETRAGTICNHRLVRRWHKVNDQEQRRIEREIKKGNRLASYGIVRASLGVHNTKKDIDELAHALTTIALHGPKLHYRPVPHEEIYVPNE